MPFLCMDGKKTSHDIFLSPISVTFYGNHIAESNGVVRILVPSVKTAFFAHAYKMWPKINQSFVKLPQFHCFLGNQYHCTRCWKQILDPKYK